MQCMANETPGGSCRKTTVLHPLSKAGKNETGKGRKTSSCVYVIPDNATLLYLPSPVFHGKRSFSIVLSGKALPRGFLLHLSSCLQNNCATVIVIFSAICQYSRRSIKSRTFSRPPRSAVRKSRDSTICLVFLPRPSRPKERQ